ncbi:hypothetical protein BV898_16961 [Hypsibius exemplaris]|uniref:Uncharacterized protein n=1 Tax=Hypsibius exemplaris TaxID=2072580 RepID=A0A9X6NMU4_HYPEX|nr:hypothetical protein BV898_16961 [Hypsibius exemplaris]
MPGMLYHVRYAYYARFVAENTCVEYRSISLAPFNASVFSKIVLKRGPGSLRKIEVPSQSTWIPKCDEDDMYDTRQRRQNNETFCVLPRLRNCVRSHQDEPFGQFHEILCDCFVERRLIRTDRHKDDIVPRCDNKTGRFKALQFHPNGKAQCVDGGIWVPNSRNNSFTMVHRIKPEKCVRAEKNAQVGICCQGRLNKDSE